VVSFSEQTQEHWTTEIPACVICAYLAMYKGINLHLRLVQVVPNWKRLPRKWPWPSGTLMESIFQERLPTMA
jgi:hypothetical protein